MLPLENNVAVKKQQLCNTTIIVSIQRLDWLSQGKGLFLGIDDVITYPVGEIKKINKIKI